jgi:hypothetical protein
MTGGEHTTESHELSERVLEVIGAYGMGAALDARNLHLKRGRDAPPPVASAHGVGSHPRQAVGPERRTVGA